ncbi:hypothetical protein B0H16DRAFT_1466270 [Mycena metata]|uniref:Uncharacterized protein n=1 Tax=Mycena metata TaxID=1033252 RepID=A0AAD7MY54_9AGAR|nr:hypothetical protein B0H16DRAFT_1466270 [Mycena metata]
MKVRSDRRSSQRIGKHREQTHSKLNYHFRSCTPVTDAEEPEGEKRSCILTFGIGRLDMTLVKVESCSMNTLQPTIRRLLQHPLILRSPKRADSARGWDASQGQWREPIYHRLDQNSSGPADGATLPGIDLATAATEPAPLVPETPTPDSSTNSHSKEPALTASISSIASSDDEPKTPVQQENEESVGARTPGKGKARDPGPHPILHGTEEVDAGGIGADPSIVRANVLTAEGYRSWTGWIELGYLYGFMRRDQIHFLFELELEVAKSGATSLPTYNRSAG